MRSKLKNIKNSKKNRQKSTSLDLTAQLEKNHQSSKNRVLAWLKNVAFGIFVAFLGLALIEGTLRLVIGVGVQIQPPSGMPSWPSGTIRPRPANITWSALARSR